MSWRGRISSPDLYKGLERMEMAVLRRAFGVLLTFTQGSKTWQVSANVGDRVMDLANSQGEVFGYCKGNLACTTCRVYVPKRYEKLLPAASRDEEDVLVEHPYTEKHPEKDYVRRMSCQLRVTEQLHGLKIQLPDPFLAL